MIAMNRNYKVVWNEIRQCYVVASELASSKNHKPLFQTLNTTMIAKKMTRTALAGVIAIGIMSAGGKCLR